MNLQRGYILFITFSMLALCTALVSVFMVKGITHKKLTLALLRQEQISQFALSLPAMGQSFLSFSADDIKDEKKEGLNSASLKPSSSDSGVEFSKKLLEKVLPVVNKTESFNLRHVDKDLPAVVNLTFFCESGKININGLYDLVNKKFYDEGISGKDQKVFATWLFDRISALTGKPSLLQPFIEHLKQRKSLFNDVTELLAIKEFAVCFSDAVFYEPQSHGLSVDKKRSKLYLTDIFTVASENDTIQPWLLSPSVCALLEIAEKNHQKQESEKKVDLSSFKQQADWSKDWDIGLKNLHGISFDKIPGPVQGMFSTQFSATVFSMLAVVMNDVIESENNIKVRIFVIFKQKKLPDNSIVYDVIKIYQV
jgi:hypothetical protein